MLWEHGTDPVQALRDRFGFDHPEALGTWLRPILASHWSLQVHDYERVLLSDHNALIWARTHRGDVVVKICASETHFEHLAAVTGIVADLATAGVPVAAPSPSREGEVRVVARTSELPLSLSVAPVVSGAFLDMADIDGAHAAGAALAQLHRAAAHLDHALPDEPRGGEPALRTRLGLAEQDPARPKAPRACAELDGLLATLPDLDGAVQVVHNDYRGANVLMQGSQVAAILDFDEMRIDHPVCDLGRATVLMATRFTTWDPTPPPVQQALVQGYAAVLPLSDLQRRWLRVVQLRLSIAHITHSAQPERWIEATESI